MNVLDLQNIQIGFLYEYDHIMDDSLRLENVKGNKIFIKTKKLGILGEVGDLSFKEKL